MDFEIMRSLVQTVVGCGSEWDYNRESINKDFAQFNVSGRNDDNDGNECKKQASVKISASKTCKF